MKTISVLTVAIVSSSALTALLMHQPAPSRVFAASAAQAQQGQPSGKIVLQDNGKPLTPAQQIQVQFAGVELEVQLLQTQLKSDENSIHALQASLQTLQTQFANHSHKVTYLVPGHPCMGIDTFLVTDAATGKQRNLGLEFTEPCSNPKWNGAIPDLWQALNVSTPVQGAQTPEQ
ncbi:MAG: hypothetical protein ABSG84_09880 [Acidobacteriaceae bacterium]|jgi:hypothetical protein